MSLTLKSLSKALKHQTGPAGAASEAAHLIEVAFQKEMEQNVAIRQTAALVYNTFHEEEKLPFFFNCVKQLLEKPDTEELAGYTLASTYWFTEDNEAYHQFTIDLLEKAAKGHWYKDMSDYKQETSNKWFSTYAYVIGEAFIQLTKASKSNYEVVSDLFVYLIQYEMERDRKRLEYQRGNKSIEKVEPPANPKKLYDDLFDYIHERSIFRTESLNDENPNEFIQILSDQMRSTRRYTIQDEITRQSLRKKKEMEKALKEREASAEELIQAGTVFPRGLELFAHTKAYNYKYYEMEKKRMTIQIVPILLITVLLGAWLMRLITLPPMVAALMGISVVLIKFLMTQKMFKPFYPTDVTTDLETEVSRLANVFFKCTQPQLESLLRRQAKQKFSNPTYVRLIPEFVQYIYTVMPKRKEALLPPDELVQTSDRIRYFIQREARAS